MKFNQYIAMLKQVLRPYILKINKRFSKLLISTTPLVKIAI